MYNIHIPHSWSPGVIKANIRVKLISSKTTYDFTFSFSTCKRIAGPREQSFIQPRLKVEPHAANIISCDRKAYDSPTALRTTTKSTVQISLWPLDLFLPSTSTKGIFAYCFSSLLNAKPFPRNFPGAANDIQVISTTHHLTNTITLQPGISLPCLRVKAQKDEARKEEKSRGSKCWFIPNWVSSAQFLPRYFSLSPKS